MQFYLHLFTSCLSILDDANLGSTEDATVELEALLLDKEYGVVLLVGLGRHEGSLVLVGVELFARGLEALQAVLGEGLDEDVLGHLEALVQVDELLDVVVLVGGVELLGGDVGQGAVEVVHAVDEVLGELLDGKVAGRLDLALGAVLEVAEVGDGAHALVLSSGALLVLINVAFSVGRLYKEQGAQTFHSRASASLASRLFFSSETSSVGAFSSLASVFSSVFSSLVSLYHLDAAGWKDLNVGAATA